MIPSNLLKICISGTCGIILSLVSSRKSGGAGKSTDKKINGLSSITSYIINLKKIGEIKLNSGKILGLYLHDRYFLDI